MVEDKDSTAKVEEDKDLTADVAEDDDLTAYVAKARTRLQRWWRMKTEVAGYEDILDTGQRPLQEAAGG